MFRPGSLGGGQSSRAVWGFRVLYAFRLPVGFAGAWILYVVVSRTRVVYTGGWMRQAKLGHYLEGHTLPLSEGS